MTRTKNSPSSRHLSLQMAYRLPQGGVFGPFKASWPVSGYVRGLLSDFRAILAESPVWFRFGLILALLAGLGMILRAKGVMGL